MVKCPKCQTPIAIDEERLRKILEIHLEEMSLNIFARLCFNPKEVQKTLAHTIINSDILTCKEKLEGQTVKRLESWGTI